MNVKQLVVHLNPHLDELVAVWLLRNFGEKFFSGVSKAKLVTWGKKELEVNSLELALANGSLLVGLGGGMFDDHVHGECAAILVAKRLGVSDDPSLKKLLNGVLIADSEADGCLYWLAEEIKNLNRYWSGSVHVEALYERIQPFIFVQVARQKEFLEARKLFDVRYKNRVCGVPVSVADAVDNPQYQHAARAGGAKVIIQRNTHGLTQIFGCEDLNPFLLAMKVRKAELSMMHNGSRPSRFISDEELLVKGTLSEIPQWCADEPFLLNGSESYPDVSPSRINFRDLVQLVEKHIAETMNRNERETKK